MSARFPFVLLMAVAIASRVPAHDDSARQVLASATDVPDPVLDALVARALTASPALARAEAALAGGHARVHAAAATYRPTLEFSEIFSNSDIPPVAFSSLLLHGDFTPAALASVNEPDAITDWASVIGLRQVLWDGGRRKAARMSAAADRERLASVLDAARRDVRYAVADALESLRRSRAEVALWEDTVRLFEEHAKLTRARREEGVALRSDELAIGVRADDAAESLAAARRATVIARARLSAAVGERVAEADVPGEPPGDVRPAGSLDELVAAVRSGHPVIRALDASVRAARATEDGARRGRHPSLVADVSGQWHADGEGLGLDRAFHAVTVALKVPLADSGRAKAAVEEAAGRRIEIEATRREAADQLELAAREAHSQALEAGERTHIAKRAIEAAAAALVIVEERYREGVAPVVDLVEAERALTDARVRELTARSRARSAVAAIERLQPGGAPERSEP